MIDEMAVLEVRHISKDYRISGENSLIAKTFHAVEESRFLCGREKPSALSESLAAENPHWPD